MNFDIFFLSYHEPNAEKNWQQLRSVYPQAMWIKDVEGESQAFKACASESKSNHFFVVEADNWVFPNWSTQLTSFDPDAQKLHVFRAQNAVNDLVYGFGAIKLWPKLAVLKHHQDLILDFPLAVSTDGVVIESEIASLTAFNANPFYAFRGAFREAVKLASGDCGYQGAKASAQTLERLKIWLTVGIEKDYGKECLMGARAGAYHALTQKDLHLINQRAWLQDYFKEISNSNHLAKIDEYLLEHLYITNGQLIF